MLMGSSGKLICFALLVHAALFYLLNCLYLNPQVFSFCSSNSFCDLAEEGMSKQLGGGSAVSCGQPITLESINSAKRHLRFGILNSVYLSKSG